MYYSKHLQNFKRSIWWNRFSPFFRTLTKTRSHIFYFVSSVGQTFERFQNTARILKTLCDLRLFFLNIFQLLRCQYSTRFPPQAGPTITFSLISLWARSWLYRKEGEKKKGRAKRAIRAKNCSCIPPNCSFEWAQNS